MQKDEQGRIIPRKEDLEQFLADRKATSISREMVVCLALERAFVDEWGDWLRELFLRREGTKLEVEYGFAKGSIRSAYTVLYDAYQSVKDEFKDDALRVLFYAFEWMQEDMETIFLNWHGLCKKTRKEKRVFCMRKPGEDFHEKEIYF